MLACLLDCAVFGGELFIGQVFVVFIIIVIKLAIWQRLVITPLLTSLLFGLDRAIIDRRWCSRLKRRGCSRLKRLSFGFARLLACFLGWGSLSALRGLVISRLKRSTQRRQDRLKLLQMQKKNSFPFFPYHFHFGKQLCISLSLSLSSLSLSLSLHSPVVPQLATRTQPWYRPRAEWQTLPGHGQWCHSDMTESRKKIRKRRLNQFHKKSTILNKTKKEEQKQKRLISRFFPGATHSHAFQQYFELRHSSGNQVHWICWWRFCSFPSLNRAVGVVRRSPQFLTKWKQNEFGESAPLASRFFFLRRVWWCIRLTQLTLVCEVNGHRWLKSTMISCPHQGFLLGNIAALILVKLEPCLEFQPQSSWRHTHNNRKPTFQNTVQFSKK